jgi:hypothetical protein
VEGAKVKKLAEDFFSISGVDVDSLGDVYFVDARWQTVYRWSAPGHQLSKARDNPLGPVQLFFDKSGDLMVVCMQSKPLIRGSECEFCAPGAPIPS